jgi:thioredoxin 1
MSNTKPTPYGSSAYATFKSYTDKNNIPKTEPQKQVSNYNSQIREDFNKPQQSLPGTTYIGPSRFKSIESSEHLHNFFTNGHSNFQMNFKSKNMQAPPMRVFLKLYTDWCGPCKKIGPVLEEISMNQEYREVIFLKFNADLMLKGQDPISKKLLGMLKIGAVPAFFGMIDGQIVGNVMGADMNEISELLQTIKK